MGDMPQNSIISLYDVTRSFGDREVLKGISLAMSIT